MQEKINYDSEEWRRLNFKDLKPDEIYEISNYGRLRHWSQKTNEFKIMKLSTVRGYRYFMWFKSVQGWDNKIKRIIHRLVAEEFCEHKNDKQIFVIHLDHDKGNNYYKNLKWVTREEMTQHNKSNPRVIESHLKRKGKITNSKLTEADVIKLRQMVKSGDYKLYKIAEHFGITHTQLNRIRSGKNWAHVKMPDEE
ncbi:MAG: HNH endonuclease [Bacteroidales bacterium]|nr:HNH endonuclease [Bacteroidales bacterium]RLD39473.1 MAG: hypothetical protein DRI74_00650 [Bacteroidota bacterium]